MTAAAGLSLEDAILRAMKGQDLKKVRVRVVDTADLRLPPGSGTEGVVIGVKWPRCSVKIGHYVQILGVHQVERLEG